jgi:hypothetical protein
VRQERERERGQHGRVRKTLNRTRGAAHVSQREFEVAA